MREPLDRSEIALQQRREAAIGAEAIEQRIGLVRTLRRLQ